MCRWLIICFYFVLIQHTVNQLRTDKDGHVGPEETSQAAEGTGKESFLFAQQWTVHSRSQTPRDHLRQTGFSPLQRQELSAKDQSSDGGQNAVALQMVHASQQSQRASLWKVRLPLASLHRFFLYTCRTSTNRFLQGLYGMARRRFGQTIRSFIKEDVGISESFTCPEAKEEKQAQEGYHGASWRQSWTHRGMDLLSIRRQHLRVHLQWRHRQSTSSTS